MYDPLDFRPPWMGKWMWKFQLARAGALLGVCFGADCGSAPEALAQAHWQFVFWSSLNHLEEIKKKYNQNESERNWNLMNRSLGISSALFSGTKSGFSCKLGWLGWLNRLSLFLDPVVFRSIPKCPVLAGGRCPQDPPVLGCQWGDKAPPDLQWKKHPVHKHWVQFDASCHQ